MALHLAIVSENTKATIAALTAQVPKRIFYTTNTNELYYSLDNGTTRLLSSLVQSIGSTNTVALNLNASGQLTSNASLSANVGNILTDSAGLYVPDLKVAANSADYITYNAGTREISVTELLRVEPFVSTENTLANFLANDAQAADIEKGDIVYTGDGNAYQHLGTSAGNATDYRSINRPQLEDSYIRGLFSANNGVAYNNSTGTFTGVRDPNAANDLSVAAAGFFVDVSASNVTDTEGLTVTAGQDTNLQSLLNALAAGGAANDNAFENGLTKTSTTVRWGGSLTQATTIAQGAFSITFTGSGLFRVQDTIELTGNSSGYLLRSADGTRYKITVENDGTLTTATA